jgi:hypothetical protein
MIPVILVLCLIFGELQIQISTQRPSKKEISVIFLSFYRRMLGSTSKWATTDSYLILPNSLFTDHPIIRHFTRVVLLTVGRE